MPIVTPTKTHRMVTDSLLTFSIDTILNVTSSGSRISQTGVPAKGGCQPILWQKFAENCMEMKKICHVDPPLVTQTLELSQTQALRVNRSLHSLQHFVDLKRFVLEFDLEVFPVVAFALAHFVAEPRDGGALQSGLGVPVLWNLQAGRR